MSWKSCAPRCSLGARCSATSPIPRTGSRRPGEPWKRRSPPCRRHGARTRHGGGADRPWMRAESLAAATPVGYAARVVPGFAWTDPARRPRRHPGPPDDHRLALGADPPRRAAPTGPGRTRAPSKACSSWDPTGTRRSPGRSVPSGQRSPTSRARDPATTRSSAPSPARSAGRTGRSTPGEKGFIGLQRRLRGITEDARARRRGIMLGLHGRRPRGRGPGAARRLGPRQHRGARGPGGDRRGLADPARAGRGRAGGARVNLEMFVLGSGGMMPLPGRALTSVLLRREGELFLFDCGEGTQVSLRRLESAVEEDLRDLHLAHARRPRHRPARHPDALVAGRPGRSALHLRPAEDPGVRRGDAADPRHVHQLRDRGEGGRARHRAVHGRWLPDLLAPAAAHEAVPRVVPRGGHPPGDLPPRAGRGARRAPRADVEPAAGRRAGQPCRRARPCCRARCSATAAGAASSASPPTRWRLPGWRTSRGDRTCSSAKACSTKRSRRRRRRSAT